MTPESRSCFARRNLLGRPASAGDRLDVLLGRSARVRHVAGLALGHASAPSNQVDDRAQERREHQSDDPQRLQPATQVTVSEQIPDDLEQNHQIHHEEEAPHQQPEEVGQKFTRASTTSWIRRRRVPVVILGVPRVSAITLGRVERLDRSPPSSMRRSPSSRAAKASAASAVKGSDWRDIAESVGDVRRPDHDDPVGPRMRCLARRVDRPVRPRSGAEGSVDLPARALRHASPPRRVGWPIGPRSA